MRNPADDAPRSPAGRRRGRAGRGGRGGHSPDARPAAESSVFGPGYASDDEPSTDTRLQLSRPDDADKASWYGSSAAGAAGKGPVRGFPPVPGQPPPMYPPGQFAAWNRDGGKAAAGPRPAGAAAGSPPRAAEPGRRSADGADYYGQRAGRPGREPGYSELAVSDPAADVTSTQTWQAVADDRATGAWTMPERPDDGTPGADGQAAPAGSRAGLAAPAVPRQHRGPGGQPPDFDGQGHDAMPERDSAPERDSGRDAGMHRSDGWDRAVAASAATTGAATKDAGNRPGSGPAGGSRTARRAAGPTRQNGRPRKRRRLSSAHLAVGVVLLLVVAAAAGLLLYSQRKPTSNASAGHSKPPASPSASPSASSTPTAPAGPYRYITSRATDPVPLTAAELFPAQFMSGHNRVVRTASKATKACSGALVGGSLQAAAKSAKCDQAVRGTYLSIKGKVMGTIGVLNLASTSDAKRAGRKAGRSGYIRQLAGHKGLTRTIARGPGLEEAEVKGHYLILVWAGLSDKHSPKTRKERGEIEHFMFELITKTANVNLSTRMVTGKP